MSALASALRVAVVALCLGAADAVLARVAHPNRFTEPALYLQSVALWACFGLAALVPAAIADAALRRVRPARRDPRARAGAGPAPGVALLGWTLYPVLAHGLLDRHTALGQDVSRLLAPRPWLELALASAAWIALFALLRRGVARLGARRVGAAVALVSVPVGLWLPHRTPPAPAPGDRAADPRPNVLLLVWDTTRADHLQPYGYGRDSTPNLARFAERSLVFENARSVSVFTFTSHVSMLTGRYPGETGARLLNTRLDPGRAESVAMHLALAGYRTGAFVGTAVLTATTGIQRGFEVYDDRVDPPVCDTRAWKLVHDVQSVLELAGLLRVNGFPHWFQDFQRSARDVLASAREWIEREDARPWFCMVNLYDVHWPYVPDREGRERWVAPYDGPMDGYLFRSDDYEDGYRPGAADRAHLRELYDAELWELDREVDRFLGALDLDRGRTAVLLTSDHGEAFGEAEVWEHDDVYEPQVRVPLLLRLPGADPPAGRRSQPVSGIDVAPTVLGLAGIEADPPLPGVDLGRELPAADRLVLVEDRDHLEPDDVRLVLYDGPWKLVRRGVGEDARVELFHLGTDPVGERDLAAAEPERAEELARRLDELRAPWADGDLEVGADGPAANADALGGLGYTDSAD